MSKETMSFSLTSLATYLDSYLQSAQIPNDQNGIYRPSQRPVKRIGLVIEPLGRD